MRNILGLAWLRAGAHSALLRISLSFLYRSAWPGPGHFRYPPHTGAKGLSLLSSATFKDCQCLLQKQEEGHGMPLLEDNTACFLILLVPSPLETLFFFFFFTRVLFSSMFKSCHSYEFPLMQHSPISSNKGSKRGSWGKFLSAADAEKHFL